MLIEIEYPCWLLKSVLLQGYMYITTKHICFYAYLPRKSVSILPTLKESNLTSFRMKLSSLDIYPNRVDETPSLIDTGSGLRAMCYLTTQILLTYTFQTVI
jgi:hypothetical protein